jgi:hypothetical protein
MKRKSLLFFAALAMLATACSKENNAVVTSLENNNTGVAKMITETITATNGDEDGNTRVDISNDADANFAWTAGDNIAVHVSNGTINKYVFTSDTGASGASVSAAEASFSVVYEDGYSRDAFADLDVARDLFGWGTSGYNNKYPYMTATNSGNYYNGSLNDTDYDWGVYHSASGNSSEKITNGGNYSWRLFTADEWSYLIARQGCVYTRTDVPTYNEIKDLLNNNYNMGEGLGL